MKPLPRLLILSLLSLVVPGALTAEDESKTDPDAAARMRAQQIAARGFAEMSSALSKAIAEGGVSKALPTCHESALHLTEEVAREGGVKLRRVASRHRNPRNAASEDETAVLKDFEESLKTKQPLQPLVRRENGRTIVFAPIVLASPLCLKCHGEPGKDIAKPDHDLIQSLYPDDKATGFKLGDLRGMWRVEWE